MQSKLTKFASLAVTAGLSAVAMLESASQATHSLSMAQLRAGIQSQAEAGQQLWGNLTPYNYEPTFATSAYNLKNYPGNIFNQQIDYVLMYEPQKYALQDRGWSGNTAHIVSLNTDSDSEETSDGFSDSESDGVNPILLSLSAQLRSNPNNLYGVHPGTVPKNTDVDIFSTLRQQSSVDMGPTYNQQFISPGFFGSDTAYTQTYQA